MSIITTTMLRYDPVTFVVYASEPLQPAPPRPPAPQPEPLGPLLCAFALAGLATRVLELAVSRRPR